MFDGKAFGEEMVGIVRGYVDRVVAPLVEQNKSLTARVVELEARVPAEGPPGKDGRDGADGRDVDPEEVTRLIKEAVSSAVAALPPPEPGPAGADGADGRDGRDADPAEVERLVHDAVEAAVAALPTPQNGKNGVDGRDGRDGIDGKDGVGVAGAIIDRGGNLHLTLTDGTTRDLGMVVGKDGRDGEAGRNGRDGFSLEAFDSKISPDGRTLTLSFSNGQEEYSHELTMPVPIYRSVWREGEDYQPGDVVTWAGSVWHTDKATSSKPDSGDWTLMIKRGRDGKDRV